MEKRIQEKKQATLTERVELYKQFRDGGWEINPVDSGSNQFNVLPDKFTGECHWRVKMPGAYAMRIKTIAQLYRMAKGV